MLIYWSLNVVFIGRVTLYKCLSIYSVLWVSAAAASLHVIILIADDKIYTTAVRRKMGDNLR